MKVDYSYILTLRGEDRVGIVAGVSGFLAERDGFILDSQQYADLETNRFFMRVEFTGAGERFSNDLDTLCREFAPIGEHLSLDWQLTDDAARMKTVIAVSKGSHCLNDILHRWSTGSLPIEITAVVSNHETMRKLTEWHGLPFHYMPVTAETRKDQERAITDLMDATGAEMLILARYMQVLSDEMTRRVAGRCINIHHSFLPAFKGAGPYARAHERGVKLIGATAHYVTADLDEGPIIEQDVERVDHRATVNDMIRIGRDVEARVLSRAIGWAAGRRILMNGARTVVFR